MTLKTRRKWIFPPRFLLFLGLFPLLSFALSTTTLRWGSLRWGQAVLGGFDLAALVFLCALWGLTRDHTPATMRRDACANDTNRLGVLIIASLLMVVIITAVAIDLPAARATTGIEHGWSLALVLGSLVMAWVFSNIIYALHYAHMFYSDPAAELGAVASETGGLRFPITAGAEHCPDYWDFVYFSLTIGMAFATSDVEILRSDFRRIAALHGFLAFFYNLIVLAFTINVTAGG